MKSCIQRLFVILLTLASATVLADASERVLWDKRPINVHLQVGSERIIHFPDNVRYWLPDTVKRHVSVLSAKN